MPHNTALIKAKGIPLANSTNWELLMFLKSMETSTIPIIIKKMENNWCKVKTSLKKIIERSMVNTILEFATGVIIPTLPNFIAW